MSFYDVLGHDRQIEVIKRGIRAGQLPPAYLFHGEEGIGKLLTARELAKAVNCLEPNDDGGCGECHACRNVESGCHPNVSVMALEVNQDTGKMRQEITVGQVRAAQESLSLRSVGPGRKLLIVDGAHLMNEEAMNAFLKTLEEPPENSHVVLVTSKPNRLLVTILSRCRSISFQPLREELVAGLLQKRLGMAAPDASLVARLTGGRVGEALVSDPKDLSERRGSVVELLSSLAKDGPSAVLARAESVAKAEGGLEDLVYFGSMWFRDMLVILVGGGQGFAYNSDMAAELSAWAGRMSQSRLEEGMSMLSQTGRALERTFNRRLMAEDLFFRLKEEVLA